VGADMRRQIEVWGKQGWFCLQLILIGEGKGANRNLGVLDAFNGYRDNEAATAARLQR